MSASAVKSRGSKGSVAAKHRAVTATPCAQYLSLQDVKGGQRALAAGKDQSYSMSEAPLCSHLRRGAHRACLGAQ